MDEGHKEKLKTHWQNLQEDFQISSQNHGAIFPHQMGE
jgi:hypothetical protein